MGVVDVGRRRCGRHGRAPARTRSRRGQRDHDTSRTAGLEPTCHRCVVARGLLLHRPMKRGSAITNESREPSAERLSPAIRELGFWKDEDFGRDEK
jgi:hypothetical protein